MFAMQPKALDSVFVERVLGVFVPNLVMTPCQTLAQARSCEESPRLFPKCPMLFWTRVKGRLR